MVLCGIFSNLQLFLFSFVRSTHVVQRSRRPRTSFRGQTQASVSHNIESLSQITRHDIPTSQIDTTAHLAHTSVQSRATLFSQHNSAPNSAITTNTPSSHVPLPAPGLHTLHTPTAQGFQQRTCVPTPSTGYGLYNLKQSLVLAQ